MTDQELFYEHLSVLAVILMQHHGNKVAVTPEQIYDARQRLTSHEIQMVTYDHSRVFGDEIVIEFRYKSRQVVKGRVV